jgi:hypothetical protein
MSSSSELGAVLVGSVTVGGGVAVEGRGGSGTGVIFMAFGVGIDIGGVFGGGRFRSGIVVEVPFAGVVALLWLAAFAA